MKRFFRCDDGGCDWFVVAEIVAFADANVGEVFCSEW